MYRITKPAKTSIRCCNAFKGETIEQKMRRVINNKEPIKDGAPIIYTERKDGVLAGTDIRTDRWEVAVEAMDKVAQAKLAQRAERAKVVPIDKPKEQQGPTDAIGGTEPNISGNPSQ